jgi:hyperosmotically inducible protein
MRKTLQQGRTLIRTTCVAAALLAAGGAPQFAAAQQDAPAQPSSVPDVRPELGRVERFVEDSLLTARVKLALLDAPDVSALDIGVRTDRGVVQLSGFVDDQQRVRRAAEIATRVPGVVSVRNAIQLKGPAS